ncbi:hypothetical protein FRC07_003550 [Ceratobasidium sp. 392]|nr:hypothetical protein FRC07_003550 [Ceratobasidium sp. 392]
MLFARGLIPADVVRGKDIFDVSITQPLTSENMSRFHFYAPFIKKFSFRYNPTDFKLDSWDPLIVYSQTTELLPNLVELSDWEGLDPRSLCVFLSRSTEVVNMPCLDIPIAGEALARLASKCPNVRELDLCPWSDDLAANDIPPQTFSSLSQFHNLHSLVSNMVILEPNTLQLLGQLPKLASLEIKDGYIEPYSSLPLQHQLAAGSFPSLLKLDINLETSEDVKRFWELVPLRTLTAVHIHVGSRGGVDFLQFIPSLCNRSPLIRELVLHAVGEDVQSGQIYGVQADMAEYLWRLPLDSTFSIAPAKFDFDGVWAKIAMFWPNLREVRCINQKMCLEDLMTLSADLPNLCTLKCDFDMMNTVRTAEHSWRPAGRPPFYPGLKELIIKPFELTQLASVDESHDLDDSAR